MGPIAIRRELHRHRRRLSAVLAVLVCSIAVAAHHSGVATGSGHGHHDTGMNAAVEMCLAAFTAVGSAVVAIVVGLIALGRWRPPPRLAPSALWLSTRAPSPRARAGPGLLVLLCVSRR